LALKVLDYLFFDFYIFLQKVHEMKACKEGFNHPYTYLRIISSPKLLGELQWYSYIKRFQISLIAGLIGYLDWYPLFYTKLKSYFIRFIKYGSSYKHFYMIFVYLTRFRNSVWR
jgi:hypothetical protein